MNRQERIKRDRITNKLLAVLDLNYPQYDDLNYRKTISINNIVRFSSVLQFNRRELDTNHTTYIMTVNFLEGRMVEC